MSTSDYLHKFKALVTTVQQLGGELGVEASCVREQLNNDETIMDTNNPSKEEGMRAQNAARDAFLAVDFLAKSDMKRFGSLIAELETSHARGVDGYPVTLVSSFDMIINYKDPSKYRALACDANEDGLSFFNDQGEQHKQCTSQGHGYSRRSGTGRGRCGGRGCGSGGVFKLLQNQLCEGGGLHAVLHMCPTLTNTGPSTTTKGDIDQMSTANITLL